MDELEQVALDQLVDVYVAKAKKRIKDLYRQTSGHCALSFSGGKDSTVVLALIKMCQEEGIIPENAIPAIFCDTKIKSKDIPKAE